MQQSLLLVVTVTAMALMTGTAAAQSSANEPAPLLATDAPTGEPMAAPAYPEPPAEAPEADSPRHALRSARKRMRELDRKENDAAAAQHAAVIAAGKELEEAEKGYYDAVGRARVNLLQVNPKLYLAAGAYAGGPRFVMSLCAIPGVHLIPLAILTAKLCMGGVEDHYRGSIGMQLGGDILGEVAGFGYHIGAGSFWENTFVDSKKEVLAGAAGSREIFNKFGAAYGEVEIELLIRSGRYTAFAFGAMIQAAAQVDGPAASTRPAGDPFPVFTGQGLVKYRFMM